MRGNRCDRLSEGSGPFYPVTERRTLPIFKDLAVVGSLLGWVCNCRRLVDAQDYNLLKKQNSLINTLSDDGLPDEGECSSAVEPSPSHARSPTASDQPQDLGASDDQSQASKRAIMRLVKDRTSTPGHGRPGLGIRCRPILRFRSELVVQAGGVKGRL